MRSAPMLAAGANRKAAARGDTVSGRTELLRGLVQGDALVGWVVAEPLDEAARPGHNMRD